MSKVITALKDFFNDNPDIRVVMFDRRENPELIDILRANGFERFARDWNGTLSIVRGDYKAAWYSSKDTGHYYQDDHMVAPEWLLKKVLGIKDGKSAISFAKKAQTW